MTVMSSMNETALAPGTGGLALNSFRIFMCVCVFSKLHMTAQSGPVILVILCHSH